MLSRGDMGSLPLHGGTFARSYSVSIFKFSHNDGLSSGCLTSAVWHRNGPGVPSLISANLVNPCQQISCHQSSFARGHLPNSLKSSVPNMAPALGGTGHSGKLFSCRLYLGAKLPVPIKEVLYHSLSLLVRLHESLPPPQTGPCPHQGL